MTRIEKAPRQTPLANGLMPGGWWHEDEATGRIVCDLCPRACALKPGDRGFCFVRENVDGEMVLSTYARSTGFCVDPIEKKPLNHFLPGTAVLSFGTAGCNLGCTFCQNWDISKSREVARASEEADPETIAEAATQLGCHSVAFTYNDPVIWAGYAVDTARACHARGVKTVAVTAGYIAPQARSYFFQEIDAANIDLKAFDEQFYRRLTRAHLQPVLDTLVWLKRETDVWFEITNLVIPGENDSMDEIGQMCDWILEQLGDEVPIHFSAFHPDFRMRDRGPTPPETLLAAYDQARTRGIKYVYVGNVHDPAHDSTYCPACSALLMERNWYDLGAYNLDGNRCRSCGEIIAGRFLDAPGTWGRRRQPVRIADYARSSSAKDMPLGGKRPEQPDESLRQGCESAEPPCGENSEAGLQRLRLTEGQKERVFHAACECVVAGVMGRPAELPDPTLDGAAEISVMGAFVTLKRRGHLRACCGSLGRPMPLIEALRTAAHRTATDDRRLPPISATELPFLDVDVSLLHDFRVIQAEGDARIDAVEIGRHGLTIQRGQAGGLLLPNVAVENSWDSETFLRQVCRKADLPSNAWKDSAGRVQTFESLIIEGRIGEDQLQQVRGDLPPLFSADELESLSQHCRSNVIAVMQGATPNYYVASCKDLNVQGVLLSLDVPSRDIHPQFARLSMRPGLPLQATLFQLSESAARWLGNLGLAPHQAAELASRVAVLYDSATHGTVAAPDLRGVQPERRALVAAQHGRYAWRYAPDGTAEQLLETASHEAEIFDPAMAGLFSFAVDTNTASFLVDNVPRPVAGPTVRQAAVAGVFYPGERQELDEFVDQLLAGETKKKPDSYPAVLVPHAGLRFSGRIAAAVYRRVLIPDRVIVLAPKHSHAGAPWAVAPHQTWALPGRQVDSDPQLARQLSAAVPRLKLDAAAHQDEHAIEVQLPLLARLAPHARVVGITIGEGNLEACHEFADRLAEVMRKQTDPPLLVVSTDLNHYAPETENQRLDRIALDAIEQLDPDLLFNTVRRHGISMCGVLPAVVVLRTLRNLDLLHGCERVSYGTSADAGGSTERVVGYAGLLFR